MYQYRYVNLGNRWYVYRRPLGQQDNRYDQYYNKTEKQWLSWPQPGEREKAIIFNSQCVHKTMREITQTVRIFDKKAKIIPNLAR